MEFLEKRNIKKNECSLIVKGVPSGKCGFTTLRNFPDFLI